MKQIRGYVFTIVAAAGFGAQPFLAKFVYSYGVGEVMLALLRVLCMTPVFGILGVLNRERFKIPVRYMLRIILLFAIDGGILATVFLQIGIREIGSSKASILTALEPVTSIVLGVLFLQESLSISDVG